MPLRSIVNTARALSYYMRRQEVSAQNLANVSTEGYKGDRIAARLSADRQAPLPDQTLDLRQGNLKDTGRPLDLAIAGDAFLVVSTDKGERLTRGGSLTLDPSGILVDQHGDPVLGTGGPIAISGKDVLIDGDGAITVDGASAGMLRLVTASDLTKVTKEGLGHFSAGSALGGAGQSRIRQGVLEEANVDAVTGMVDLISIQRAWATNTEAMKAMDSVLATVTGDIGKV